MIGVKYTAQWLFYKGGKDWIIDTRNGAYLDSMITEAPKQFIYLPDNGHLLTAERKI
jgi:hypothetical protein